MESERGRTPSTDDARRQLDALEADRKWAGLVSATSETFQILLSGGVCVSVLLFAAASVDFGPDPDTEGMLALVWLAMPFIAQAQVLHDLSGSYVGAKGKRPRVSEIGALVAAYLAGLFAALWAADRGWWPVVVISAAGTGVIAAWISARWIRRYREDSGYRTRGRVVTAACLYAVLLGVCALVLATLWNLAGHWIG